MSQAFWKVYKAKVLQTFGSEQEEELHEERDQPELIESGSPPPMDEGMQSVSQLAQKVQGAGAKGWRTMASLFNKEDEHKLLTPDPVPDHPLAPKPEEPPKEKKLGLWDVFATKWQQTSINRDDTQSEYSEHVAENSSISEEPVNEDPYSSNGNETPEPAEMPFKWGFLTSKLAELKSKNAPKSN
ncbi:hypothetical protein NDU88_001578 [Pleurodeles waltl]|uniref:Testis development-related protein n=1 Tax=Pleurodeles waltl TaxID=8319 RepID=A0AAV7TIP4_PLEWA|nr:hypothetical protein NDU88_001578 [Pleurodeles waltl]